MDPARQHLIDRRKAMGLTQERFAEAVGVDRSTVARWERGTHTPQPWQRRAIARVLDVDTDELEALLRSTRTSARTAVPATRTDLVAVAILREKVAALAAALDRAPSGPLLAEAARCLEQIVLLRERAPAGIGRDLLAAEAEACVLLGDIVWDASGRRDQDTPSALFDRAGECARRTGDVATESRALLRRGQVALYGTRDPETGTRLALDAAAVAAGTSDILVGHALLHVAEGHAMLGREAACEQTLRIARTALSSRRPGDPEADRRRPGSYQSIAGSCYLRLGQPRRAQELLEQAAGGPVSGTAQEHAVVLGRLALALLHQHLVEEAVVRLHQALDVVEKSGGAGALGVVFTVGHELGRHRSEPSVEAARDRLLRLFAGA